MLKVIIQIKTRCAGLRLFRPHDSKGPAAGVIFLKTPVLGVSYLRWPTLPQFATASNNADTSFANALDPILNSGRRHDLPNDDAIMKKIAKGIPENRANYDTLYKLYNMTSPVFHLVGYTGPFVPNPISVSILNGIMSSNYFKMMAITLMGDNRAAYQFGLKILKDSPSFVYVDDKTGGSLINTLAFGKTNDQAKIVSSGWDVTYDERDAYKIIPHRVRLTTPAVHYLLARAMSQESKNATGGEGIYASLRLLAAQPELPESARGDLQALAGISGVVVTPPGPPVRVVASQQLKLTSLNIFSGKGLYSYVPTSYEYVQASGSTSENPYYEKSRKLAATILMLTDFVPSAKFDSQMQAETSCPLLLDALSQTFPAAPLAYLFGDRLSLENMKFSDANLYWP